MDTKTNISRKQWNRIKARLVKVLMMIFDALAVNCAYLMALVLRYYVRFEFDPDAMAFLDVFLHMARYYGVICVAIFYLFRLYDAMWEFGGLRDLNRIFMACIVTAAVQVAGSILFYERLPLSYYALGFLIQFALICLGRFGYRLYLMERDHFETLRKASIRVLVVGIGKIGQFARRQVEMDKNMKVVCMIATRREASRYLDGVPVVFGLDKIPQILEKKKINCVILADQLMSEKANQRVKAICDQYHVEVQDFAEFLQFEADGDVPIALRDNEGETQMIPFSPPDITDKEINEVRHALLSGWITTGPRTKELERKLAAYSGTSRMVCLNSATAAEELNFRVCGIGEGDEVIVPAYTYTATASAAIHCGAKVIFVDSQKDNCEMDYDKVAQAITERTKAVVAVDLGGVIADYDKLYAAVESRRELFRPKQGEDLGSRIQQILGRVLVFADCAHSLGASRDGRKAGQFADFSSFSFHAVKNFTTAEGGAATWRDIPGIDNEELYRQYQLYSLHGQSKDALAKTKMGAWEYDIVGPWYKCNMTDVMAAIGLKQLERYDGLLERRHSIITKYDTMCDELGIRHLNHTGSDFRSSGHLYLTRIPGIDEEQRQQIIVLMAQMGVATNVHYKPLPMMTAYRELGWDIQDFPNAYDYYHNLITLPLHTRLSDEDVDYIIACYQKAVAAVRESQTV